ncbi:glycosyltransferase family 4 protein [Pseudomonas sp. NPDC089422]|uniref:glycosyltransferase family 4 protein n=1 Tax=Pseudomonas sp. NPDC089422 TaxID=3364466 RepID=UPI00382A7500
MLSNDRQIDRRILLQADSLQEAGWQVTILAMPLDKRVTHEDERIQRIGALVETQARKENRILQIYRLARSLMPMNGFFMRKIKSFAWRFVIDQERFYMNLFMADGRRHVADVVVAHDLPMLAVGRALAEEFNAALVYDSHELFSEQEFTPGEQRSWADIERRHVRSCKRVITVNPSIAHELESRYAISEVAVIHNAERICPLGARSWYLHERFAIPRDHFVLLFQGGFSAGRNLEELVQAMAYVSDPRIHLVFLGEGQLSERLQRLTTKKRVGSRVHFHPAVPQAQLLEVTTAADAGVIPYQAICLNNYYCTPNKLFEFISAGLPILASDLPELRRLVAGNAIGRVESLDTPEKMASAITAMFQNADQLQAWRDNLLTVRETLSWQREGERLKQIYEELK